VETISRLGLAPQRGPAYGNMQSVPNSNFEPMMPMTVHGMPIPELSAMGSTVSGQRWALKAVHPNGEMVTSAAGIPDHTHIPVVTPEYRSNYVIEGLGGTANDNVDIIFIGSPDLSFLWRRYQAGTTGNDTWNAVYYSASQALSYIRNYETAPDSAEPGGTKVQAAVVNGNSGTQYARARAMYAGITVTMDAPALKDQGRCVAAQLPLMKDQQFQAVEVVQTGTPAYPLVEANSIYMGEVPLTEDDLFQTTPGAVVHEAREGVYIPLRFNEPVHNFISLDPASETSGAPVLSHKRVNDPDSSVLTFRSSTTGRQYGCEGAFNMLTGVILFRGIDATTNLSVKTRIGVEAQVDRSSSSAPFQHQSPPLDREAIDFVTRFAQEEAMAFPACFNDSNGMMDVIKQFLGLVKIGSGIAGNMGIPFVGGVSSFLDALGLAPQRGIAQAGRRIVRR
jgi:hypothetical protein